jgi:predicted site-specific integrase-resolvase
MLIPSDTPEDFRPLVTATTIAEVCSVTSASIYMWARSGVIPCIRISQNTVRFVPGHVEMALGLPHGIIRPQISKKEIQPLDRQLGRRWR